MSNYQKSYMFFSQQGTPFEEIMEYAIQGVYKERRLFHVQKNSNRVEVARGLILGIYI